MSKFLSDRPTLRGFLIIALIALTVVVLNLYTAVIAIGMLLRIAFFLAVAFFIYLLWRDRRDEIETWSVRERVVFYGSALLIVAVIGLYFWHGWPGYEQLGFIGVVACAGFAMFRVWRDRHSYRL
jgi:prepilin signal peptidase PulO-like enzyme (type II secretory pathway)